MRIMEFNNTFRYHSTLNPVAWSDLDLKPEVRLALLRIARNFINYLNLPQLDVRDIVLVGSNANYNWNSYSDFDVHVIASYDSINCDADEALFKAKKDLWNNAHDITIHGFDVELYVQDVNERLESKGQFSLLNNEWLSEPRHEPPKIDDMAVTKKTKSMMHHIDQVVDHEPSVESIERIQDKIKRMRRSGLAERGEFSIENLVFKNLRNAGYLDRLSKTKTQLTDNELSLQ